MKTNTLRKAEKDALHRKITIYLGKIFRYKISVEKYRGYEIAEMTGLDSSRVTKFQNIDKYNRLINDRQLALVLRGGLLTIDDLKQNGDLTEKEKNFLVWFCA